MPVKPQFCLRSLPEPLWQWLEDTARNRGQKINETVIELLDSVRSKGAGPTLFEPTPKLIASDPASIPFRFIDLFAGIGGFRLALNKLGGDCVFTSEWDKFSQKTYANWYGEMPTGDINEVNPESIPDHDVLAAGFPCQPFSIAGVSKKRSLGQADGFRCERQGNLFFKICDIIDAKRPPVLMLENVKNLRSHDRGQTWAVIKQELEQRNYIVFSDIIDACHWVPQHRERIFIVCFDKQVFGDSVDFEYPDTSSMPKRRFGDILEDDPDEKYILTDHLWNYLQQYAEKHKAKGNGFGFGMTDLDGISRTISARYYKDGSEILIPRGKGQNPRRLTIVEAARLMGFGELVNHRDDVPVSDTQSYKQFGNAVVPAVVRAVGENVLKVMITHHQEATNGCLIKGITAPQTVSKPRVTTKNKSEKNTKKTSSKTTRKNSTKRRRSDELLTAQPPATITGMDQAELNKVLSKAFRRKIPTGPQICAEAMRSFLAEKQDDPKWIKANFSRLVEEIQVAAYRLYQEYEKKSGAEAFKEVLGPMLPSDPSKDDFFALLGGNFTAMDRFFLGLTQGRRPRAGKAFEQVIQVLFTSLSYPYTSQAKIDGQPDFLLPSEAHYNKFPMDCLIFTAKRTLRERWRQITTEGAKGLHFFLATIDETIRERDLAEMLSSRIYLVVPERIEREFYPGYQNVISFEKFFDQHLDPAMTRWRSNKVIASEQRWRTD